MNEQDSKRDRERVRVRDRESVSEQDLFEKSRHHQDQMEECREISSVCIIALVYLEG